MSKKIFLVHKSTPSYAQKNSDDQTQFISGFSLVKLGTQYNIWIVFITWIRPGPPVDCFFCKIFFLLNNCVLLNCDLRSYKHHFCCIKRYIFFHWFYWKYDTFRQFLEVCTKFFFDLMNTVTLSACLAWWLIAEVCMKYCN